MNAGLKAHLVGLAVLLACLCSLGLFVLAVHVAFAQPTGTNFGGLIRLPLTTVANLPTCNAAFAGVMWAVSDQATAVAYNGAVTGSGATNQKVYCNGSTWVQQ